MFCCDGNTAFGSSRPTPRSFVHSHSNKSTVGEPLSTSVKHARSAWLSAHRNPKRICLHIHRARAEDEGLSQLAEILDDVDEAELEKALTASAMRPWTFLIPSLDEVATNRDWHLKVADWKTFWAMFNNWLWVYQQLMYLEENNLAMDPEVEEQMDWLQIDSQILAGDVTKLVKVVDGIVDGLRDLKMMGYPVPDEIDGKYPGYTGSKSRKHRVDDRGNIITEYGKIESSRPQWDVKQPVEREPESWEYSSIKRPWDDWDAWEYRVYMEKKRMHRRQQAKFAKKQAEIGKFKHLVVSPSTDSRWAKDAYFYPIKERDYTHEEIMWKVRVQGDAVDPLEIPIRVVDPDSHADAFQEGVHYVPDTIEYIREIGHLCENEEELIGERLDSGPSATLDEEFAEDGESPLDDIDGEDSGTMDGMEVTSDADADDDGDAE